MALGAQNSWLTLLGDPFDPQTDVVQVDPQSRPPSLAQPTLNVRVSWSTLRTSWDNVPYRSYMSTVVVDCSEKTARYAEITFYMMPLWQGKPHKTSIFAATQPRPLLLRDMQISPAVSVIKAACMSASR